ncbi:MAG: hypothetical protein ACREQR_15040 [Candidatus Binataceae bacterium]
MQQLERLMHKPAPPSVPTIQQCPFYLSDIPIAATKCAHCTAELKAAA